MKKTFRFPIGIIEVQDMNDLSRISGYITSEHAVGLGILPAVAAVASKLGGKLGRKSKSKEKKLKKKVATERTRRNIAIGIAAALGIAVAGSIIYYVVMIRGKRD